MVPLLGECGDVLVLVSGEHHASQALELSHDGLFGGRPGLRQLEQQRADPSQQPELLGYDRVDRAGSVGFQVRFLRNELGSRVEGFAPCTNSSKGR